MAVSKSNSLPKYLGGIGAKPGRFRAGVSYFPHCIDHEKLVLEGALLILIGDKERKSNLECAREVVATAKERKQDANIKFYPGASHAFTLNFRGLCEQRGWCHDPEATADAEMRTIRFFTTRLEAK